MAREEGRPGTRLAHDAEQALGSTLAELREGITFIRSHRAIGWSLIYLAIAASLIGVLGVLGTGFATDSLGLEPKDFVVVVLPLGFGIVTGILLLNSFGHLLPRRRIIEGGLVALGILHRPARDRRPDRAVPAARRDGDRPRLVRGLHVAARRSSS